MIDYIHFQRKNNRSINNSLVLEITALLKKLYGPFFLWMGFNCLKARATSRRQFTFYHCSTTHAIIEITESVRKSCDNSLYFCGVFLDLKKTLDIVHHKILLTKLEYYGIWGEAKYYFSSFIHQTAFYFSWWTKFWTQENFSWW